MFYRLLKRRTTAAPRACHRQGEGDHHPPARHLGARQTALVANKSVVEPAPSGDRTSPIADHPRQHARYDPHNWAELKQGAHNGCTVSLYIQCCDFSISLTHVLTNFGKTTFKSLAGFPIKFAQKLSKAQEYTSHLVNINQLGATLPATIPPSLTIGSHGSWQIP